MCRSAAGLWTCLELILLGCSTDWGPSHFTRRHSSSHGDNARSLVRLMISISGSSVDCRQTSGKLRSLLTCNLAPSLGVPFLGYFLLWLDFACFLSSGLLKRITRRYWNVSFPTGLSSIFDSSFHQLRKQLSSCNFVRTANLAVRTFLLFCPRLRRCLN